MSGNLLNRIENMLDDLTKSQRKVATYILREPIQAAFSTIDQISHTAGTSTATVVRLAERMGYERYALFQTDLKGCIQKSMAPSLRLEASFENASKRNDIISDVIQIQMDNLKNTIEKLNFDQLYRICEQLSDCNHIYVTGARSCTGVSRYLTYNLERITRKCDYINPLDDMVSEKLMHVQTGDLLIAMSYPRYINAVVKCATIAKNRGAHIVIISDKEESPFQKICDDFICTSCGSFDFHNSTLSANLVAEILIAIMTQNAGITAKANLVESEAILKDLMVHTES